MRSFFNALPRDADTPLTAWVGGVRTRFASVAQLARPVVVLQVIEGLLEEDVEGVGGGASGALGVDETGEGVGGAADSLDVASGGALTHEGAEESDLLGEAVELGGLFEGFTVFDGESLSVEGSRAGRRPVGTV
jgi:hypothetical protein